MALVIKSVHKQLNVFLLNSVHRNLVAANSWFGMTISLWWLMLANVTNL